MSLTSLINPNPYLVKLLNKKRVSAEDKQRINSLIHPLYPKIKRWAGKYYNGIFPSGSFAKGTSVKGSMDIDLLVSLKNQTPHDLQEIYNSLFNLFNGFLETRKQNVSIRIKFNGINIDLVPAKKMPNATYPHSIYLNKKNTWTKTNIQKHISIVKNSFHRNIIILLKIWRDLHGLDFPSFLLELCVIDALKRIRVSSLEKNFLLVLEYLINDFEYARIVDPANTQNVISDTLTNTEKQKIIKKAEESNESKYWENIIWGLYEKK